MNLDNSLLWKLRFLNLFNINFYCNFESLQKMSFINFFPIVLQKINKKENLFFVNISIESFLRKFDFHNIRKTYHKILDYNFLTFKTSIFKKEENDHLKYSYCSPFFGNKEFEYYLISETLLDLESDDLNNIFYNIPRNLYEISLRFDRFYFYYYDFNIFPDITIKIFDEIDYETFLNDIKGNDNLLLDTLFYGINNTILNEYQSNSNDNLENYLKEIKKNNLLKNDILIIFSDSYIYIPLSGYNNIILDFEFKSFNDFKKNNDNFKF